MAMFGGDKHLGVATVTRLGVGGSFDFFPLPLFIFKLENNLTVPTLQPGHHPLHKFLGFNPNNYLLSMSAARYPNDGREMPPNDPSHSHMSVNTLQGVRKVRRFLFYFQIIIDSYIYILSFISYLPQIAVQVHTSSHVRVNLTPSFKVSRSDDTPFTNPPYSQNRLTKSIGRSSAWLSNLLQPNPGCDSPMNIIVHMAGGTSCILPARKAFAENLMEKLHEREADAIKPSSFKLQASSFDSENSMMMMVWLDTHSTRSPTVTSVVKRPASGSQRLEIISYRSSYIPLQVPGSESSLAILPKNPFTINSTIT